ncbi:hypothetical protein [Streptomyces specialis]|uniref:hypothetical protein n=1 Tax=Streptomyces specialis TaxID=498367 RepID=UPI00073F9233|nr:hypothetical protein [Streptomyces specialis]
MTDTSKTWDAAPRGALWYGEIIYGRDVTDDEGAVIGSETDYAYGYSTDPLPDPGLMCPPGATVLEEALTHLASRATLTRQEEDDAPEREFRVWCESGDLIAATDTYEDAADALREAVRADIARHGPAEAACGVLSSYGYSIQVTEDGADITQDFANNNPDRPLDDGVIAGEGE